MSKDEFPDLPTISDIFTNIELADGSSLDKKMVGKLVNLKNDEKKPVFSVDEPGLIMNIISMIDQMGFEDVYNYLRDVRDKDEIDIIKNAPIFLDVRKNNFMELTKNMVIKRVHQSVQPCKSCGRKNVSVDVFQLRSSDEGATEEYKCNDCGYKWRIG